MNKKQRQQLLGKIGLKEEDLQTIKDSVQAAEQQTNGEIALALIKESDDYTLRKVLVSLGAGIFVFFILVPFASQIFNLLSSLLWYPPLRVLLAAYICAATVIAVLIFFIVNIPALERLIISGKLRYLKVHRRALQHFVESGVYRTRAGTGILIFLSAQERRVVIIADAGISAKIEQAEWNKICSDLIEAIKTAKAKQGLVQAIEHCGNLLQQHFPKEDGNPNELPDGLVLLYQ